MADLDLTEALAALEEAPDALHTIRFLGRGWTIPTVMPPLFAMEWIEGNSLKSLRAVLGNEQFDELCGLRPTTEHLAVLRDGVFSLYGGGDPGKSSEQRKRSKSNGTKSKRTSNGGTSGT